MFKCILIIIPVILLAGKEEVRLLYPQIWTELVSCDFDYSKQYQGHSAEHQYIAIYTTDSAKEKEISLRSIIDDN